MKKRVAICLLLALAFSCAGCGSAPAQSVSEPAPTETQERLPAETAAPVQEPESEPQAAEEAAAPEAHSTTLVVYFSATGTTRGVAERIAALTGGDLAEIVPLYHPGRGRADRGPDGRRPGGNRSGSALHGGGSEI